MSRKKAPAPRGYDPGGFRFPGRTPFIDRTERYDERHREHSVPAVAALSPRDVGGLAAAAASLIASAIVRGRRRP